ncbi:MAG: TetR/AcrR family transcriptional regulator [Pseudomonadota bacterium]|nr:TetR/AcrR family transcriptional regulator [Pseudomonadota bacterium]
MVISSVDSKAEASLREPLLSKKARAVLDAARDIFLANGFAGATTDMIQQAAGVSKSTMYAHYPNKEALFAAVVEAECEQFLKTVRKPKLTGERLSDILNSMAQAYLEIVLSQDGLALYRMIVAEAPRFPELGRRFYLAGPATINGIVAERLQTAASRGELDLGGIGVDSAAALFVNMVRGEAQMQCLMHPDAPASAAQRDQWAKDAVTAFLRAFQKRAEAEER